MRVRFLIIAASKKASGGERKQADETQTSGARVNRKLGIHVDERPIICGMTRVNISQLESRDHKLGAKPPQRIVIDFILQEELGVLVIIESQDQYHSKGDGSMLCLSRRHPMPQVQSTTEKCRTLAGLTGEVGGLPHSPAGQLVRRDCNMSHLTRSISCQ